MSEQTHLITESGRPDFNKVRPGAWNVVSVSE